MVAVPIEGNPKFSRENLDDAHRRLVAYCCGKCTHYFGKYCDQLQLSAREIAERKFSCPLPNGRSSF